MIQNISPQFLSILAAANQAPSGENSQPWRFTVTGNRIDVFLIVDRDRSFYNWGQRAAYVSIGALLENASIAATVVGYIANVTYFPQGESDLVASIELIQQPGIKPDELEPQIFLRSTNRKIYLPATLAAVDRHALDSCFEKDPVEFSLVDDRTDIKRLAQVGAANEEIMLTNQSLHQFFFSHINWTKTQDDENKVGFFIKTLELSGPATAFFYIMQQWPIMQILSSFGFEKFIGTQNAATYAASSAMGALYIPSDEPKNFLLAGRALQRIWLTATKLGLSIQPLTGILYFKLKMDAGEGNVFSAVHQTRIQEEYAAVQKIFACPGKRVVCMFRLGSGAAPSAHSSRFDLERILTVQ